MRQFLLFGLAGTLGFLVDASVLLLVSSHLGPYLGRVVSFIAAVLTTWSVNRSLAFRHRRASLCLPRELAIYTLTMLAGGTVNLATYALLVHLLGLEKHLLLAAVALGSFAGMMVNFWLSSIFIFPLTRKARGDGT